MTRYIRAAFLASFLLLAVFACAAAHAQQQAPPPLIPAPPVLDEAPPPGDGETQMLRDMQKERNLLRQKEIIAETNRLLDLAKQLKAAVDKSNKDQLSLDVVDTAGEIEKLAKSVKQKMRDGD